MGEQGLLGREGLAQALTELGGQAAATEILDYVLEHAASASDDMTACVIRPVHACGDGRIQEELEIGWALEHPEDLAELLTDCGLDPDEAERAIAASRARSAGATPAVLHVEKTPWVTRWEIAVDDPQDRPASARSAEAVPA